MLSLAMTYESSESDGEALTRIMGVSKETFLRNGLS